MQGHAILAAAAMLMLVGSHTHAQTLRHGGGFGQGSNGAQTTGGQGVSSSASSAPRHFYHPDSRPQGQAQRHRAPDGHGFAPNHGANRPLHNPPTISWSGFTTEVPTMLRPDPHQHKAQGRHQRGPKFRHSREIVIVEVPWVVVNGAAAPVVSSYGWVDPGYYADNSASTPWREPNQIAPFDPTPLEVVDRMLALAGVHHGDVVYDLGAGDGRVVIAAAKKYGVRAVGFEIDPGLAKLARENVRKEGVETLVQIREENFLSVDLSPATVVTLYLSYDGNLAVRPRLMTQLKPGARIVSYTFDMGEWQPKIAEAYRDAGGDLHTLYLWNVGGPLLFSDTRR